MEARSPCLGSAAPRFRFRSFLRPDRLLGFRQTPLSPAAVSAPLGPRCPYRPSRPPQRESPDLQRQTCSSWLPGSIQPAFERPQLLYPMRGTVGPLSITARTGRPGCPSLPNCSTSAKLSRVPFLRTHPCHI